MERLLEFDLHLTENYYVIADDLGSEIFTYPVSAFVVLHRISKVFGLFGGGKLGFTLPFFGGSLDEFTDGFQRPLQGEGSFDKKATRGAAEAAHIIFNLAMGRVKGLPKKKPSHSGPVIRIITRD